MESQISPVIPVSEEELHNIIFYFCGFVLINGNVKLHTISRNIVNFLVNVIGFICL